MATPLPSPAGRAGPYTTDGSILVRTANQAHVPVFGVSPRYDGSVTPSEARGLGRRGYRCSRKRPTPDSSVACGALGMTVNGEPRVWPPAARNTHMGPITHSASGGAKGWLARKHDPNGTIGARPGACPRTGDSGEVHRCSYRRIGTALERR